LHRDIFFIPSGARFGDTGDLVYAPQTRKIAVVERVMEDFQYQQVKDLKRMRFVPLCVFLTGIREENHRERLLEFHGVFGSLSPIYSVKLQLLRG
jgi:hypothetical protein